MEPTTSQRPTTHTAGWIAIAVATVAISVPADLFITLLFTMSCSQPADPQTLLCGRIAMLIVLFLAALPWLLMVPLSRNGGQGVLIGTVALLPALAFVVYSFTPAAGTSALCLA